MDPTNVETFWVVGTVVFIALCAGTWLFYQVATKEEAIKAMQEEHARLMRSFNELDDQAKMIVRTDLELNRIREEMNKRLNGLNALQRTSRQMSQALNEEEIFQKLSPELFEDLGFSQVLVASRDEHDALKVRLRLGYDAAKADAIAREIAADETFKSALQQEHCVSSISGTHKVKERIIPVFGAEHFILAPVLTQTGSIGFIFAGNRYNAAEVTQGDEELVTLMGGQIGQSIENARLFEKVFRSSQELELKVSERTKQLAGALQKVREISDKKSEFVSAVSHELRTPLTSIKGYASLLITGKIGEVPAPVKERLGKINTHSDNLVGLINDLLDIARIESGRQEMKFSVYKIKHIVDNVTDLLTPQVTAKGINLQLRLAPGIGEVYVDTTQVERVIINLLSNAVKFTPTGGTITIATASVLEEGYVKFNVTDTGIGIPPEDLKKLFSEFFRVENEINQNVKGTGLGLVLARNIVQAHRGKMWVQSQPGAGTTFYFTLPPSKEALQERLNKEKNDA